MPDVPPEDRRSSGGCTLLIAFVVAGLAAWWLWTTFVPDAIAPMATLEDATEPGTSARAGLPARDLVRLPAAWAGQQVSGTAQVLDVPTDRGMWIEADGEHLLVILLDPVDEPVATPGEQVMLSDAIVADGPAAAPLDLDADTRTLLVGEQVFLTVAADDVEALDG